MKNVIAMVLAGGRGKRMDILCHGRSKPLLPFAGRWRVIDFSLSNCLHSGINNVVALIDHQRHSMAEYLEEWSMVNTHGNGLHIMEPKSGFYKGTSDAIYQHLDYLTDQGCEFVLVLAGDHVYKMDYRKILTFHANMEADVTMGVITVPIQQAYRFGIVTTDSENRITSFVEKPNRPVSNLASMGIYVFKTDVLVKYLLEDSTEPDSPHDFGYALIPRMLKSNKILGYKFGQYWQDIGTIETYYEANMELNRPHPSMNLDSSWPILTVKEDFPTMDLSDTGVIKHSMVSPGCTIHGTVENSVLSPGVVVGEKSEVTNSIIMANTTIGKHSVVDRCILDEGVNVGKFCYIGFGAQRVLSSSSITVLGRDTIVRSSTAVGRNIRVAPGTILSSHVFSRKHADKVL